MRVLFFSHIHPNPLEPHRGTYNVTLLRALAGQHEIRVLSPVAWTTAWKQRHVKAVASDYGWPAAFPRFYFPPRVLRDHYAAFMWHSVKNLARRAIDEFAPDIVLSNWAHPDGAVATRIARVAGVPSIVTVGGSDVLVLARNGKRRRVILESLSSADSVVTVSEDMRCALIRQGIDPAHVRCVYRGVDHSVFCPGDRATARERVGMDRHERAMLFVGNLSAGKGIDVLLRACARLRESGRSFRLYVAGGGALAGELKRLSSTLGLDAHVRFVGAVAHRDLADWYRAVNMTVLASLSEGVPNVLVESSACGTPFVATRVGGIPEIADPVLDRLVAPGDPCELATALGAALDTDPADRRQRATPPRCSKNAASEYTRLMHSLVDRRVTRTDWAVAEARC